MAQILTDVIISNTKGDEKGDHFWDNGESNLLKSLILYVDLDSTRTPEERNLAAVYQMLTQHTEKQLTRQVTELFSTLAYKSEVGWAQFKINRTFLLLSLTEAGSHRPRIDRLVQKNWYQN